MPSLPPEQRRALLPVFVRYKDLVESGIVRSWTQLLRMIDDEDFPAGVMLGPHTRPWRADEVQEWLAARPTARKPIPPNARHPRARKPADADVADEARS
jgi:predicted DNA-binding transcriptional regulator AlpA